MSAEEYIGVPGDLVHSKDADVEGCKAGGLPWLWEELPRESLNAATQCEFCGAARSLVLQVHAPLRGKSTSRVILLFVCTSDACCGAPHAFAAIRCQRQTKEADADSGRRVDPGSTELSTVTWGDAANSVASSSTALPAPQPDLDFSDLLANMDRLAVSNENSLPPAAGHKSAAEHHSVPPTAVPQFAVECRGTAPVLPEFWIGFRTAHDSQAPANSDDAHIQQLLQEYQQDAGTAEAPSGNAGTGEHYEKTDPHTKFLERLSRHPSQCVRYGWGMQGLWPSDKMPDAGCCRHCGAACVPELQVLSPMWYFMEETVAWYDGVAHRAPDQLDASVLSHSTWDWEAVHVFTCSSSCYEGTAAVCVAHERVAAFNLASAPGHASDLAASERLSAAMRSEPALPDAEVVDPASAATAAAEEGIETIETDSGALAPANQLQA